MGNEDTTSLNQSNLSLRMRRINLSSNKLSSNGLMVGMPMNNSMNRIRLAEARHSLLIKATTVTDDLPSLELRPTMSLPMDV